MVAERFEQTRDEFVDVFGRLRLVRQVGAVEVEREALCHAEPDLGIGPVNHVGRARGGFVESG